MQFVQSCCQTSLLLLRFEDQQPFLKCNFEDQLDCSLEKLPPSIDLPVADSVRRDLPDDPLWKNIVQTYSRASLSLTSPSQSNLFSFVQLLKIMITLSVNNYLLPVQDDTLQDLIQLLQEVDPLAHFVALVAKFELYAVVHKILKLRTLVMEIFAGKLLPYAIELGDTRLTRLLLQAGCSLTARKRVNTGFFTSLEIAVWLQRDLTHVILLLDAQNKPSSSMGSRDIHYALKSIPRFWCETPSVTDHEILKHLLEAKCAEDAKNNKISTYARVIQESLKHNRLDICRVIVEWSLKFVDDRCRTQSALFVTAVANADGTQLRHILEEATDWQASFRQDIICQDIFQGLLGLAIMGGEPWIWYLFSAYGPELCSDYGRHITALVEMYVCQIGDETRSLRILEFFGADVDSQSLRYICKIALARGRLDILRLPICQQRGLHFHQVKNGRATRRRCWVQSEAVRKQLLSNPKMMTFLISTLEQDDEDKALCCLEAATLTGNIAVFRHFVKSLEAKMNGLDLVPLRVDKLLTESSVLSLAMGLEDPGIFLWLIKTGVSFENLNYVLDNDLDGTIQDPRLSFAHPTAVLQSALSTNLYPSRGILVLCALSNSTHDFDNVHIVYEAAQARNAALSPEELTICLNLILQNISARMATPPIKVLKLLAHFGAIAEDPWTRYALQSGSADDYRLLQETIISEVGPMYVAIRNGDLTLLKALFAKGLGHDKHSWAYGEHMTPLQYASLRGQANCVLHLLQHGASVNKPAYHISGLTALQAAVIHGHFQIVVKLIQLGANINAPASTFWGRTALEGAAEWGRLDIVHLLIKNNDDAQALRKDCKRASRVATYNNHSVLARMLADHARTLAEQLSVNYEDEIDELCECDIKRWLDIPCNACGREESVPIEEYYAHG